MASNQYQYAVEKLTTALQVLTTHEGDARQRLACAYLSFHTLSERDFPPELADRWRWVTTQLTKFGPLLGRDGEVLRGSVDNTMRRVQKRTAAKIIEVIVDLYWAVSENERYR